MKHFLFPLLVTLVAQLAAAAPANAQNRADSSGCREEGPLPGQIRCFLDAAEAAGDVGLCDGAYDFAVRFNCISLFAEHSGDVAACARIPLRNNRLLVMRDSCVSGVAAATRTPDLCAQVQLEAVRDACFLLLVVEHGAAPAYCERITRTAVRKNCATPPARRR